MKTIKYFAVAVSLFAAVSCLNDNMEMPQTEGKVFTAAFADGENTKAVLKPGTETSAVEWETTDAVSILAGENNWQYQANAAGASTTLEAVTDPAEGDKFYALFPYDGNATLNGSVITTTLPAEQVGVQGSFSAHMAVAYTETDALSFKNVCGLVRVKVASEGVTKVVFEGNNGENVAGAVNVTVADAPSWTAADGASKTVALVAEEGTLATGDYYLAVLPQTFEGGFNVKVYKGETLVQTKTVSADLTLERCQVVPGTIGVTASSISPIIATAGQTITVTGSGFTEGTTVTIDGKDAEVTSQTATTLAVTVPEGLSKSTDYKLSVNVEGFDAVESEPFRYYYLPTYTAATVCGTSGTGGLKEGVGTASKIHSPYFIGEGPDGKLWFTCANAALGSVCTFDYAGTQDMKILVAADDVADTDFPYGGAFDPVDNSLHIALKGSKTNLANVTSAGVYSTYSFATGMGSPMDICFDSEGVKYVAVRDSKLVYIEENGVVSSKSLGFQPISLDLDPKEEYLYIGTNAGWYIYRMNLATLEIEKVAGNGTKPASGSASSFGDAGNPLSAIVGNIQGMYCDSDGYLYYLDQQYCTMNVLIPGVNDDPKKGVILKVYGTVFNNGFLGSNGGQLTKASDGNFYVTANGKHKIAKVYIK